MKKRNKEPKYLTSVTPSLKKCWEMFFDKGNCPSDIDTFIRKTTFLIQYGIYCLSDSRTALGLLEKKNKCIVDVWEDIEELASDMYQCACIIKAECYKKVLRRNRRIIERFERKTESNWLAVSKKITKLKKEAEAVALLETQSQLVFETELNQTMYLKESIPEEIPLHIQTKYLLKEFIEVKN